MLIPSIDLKNGDAVQLIGGKEQAMNAGDPLPLLKQFGLVGEVAVIDLDAALGTGSNAELIGEMLTQAKCRVGGGIRDYQNAVRWLDAGADKIIIGTAASPELLRKLPKDRTIVALDAVHGEVVTHGWTQQTSKRVTDELRRLSPFTGGFLLTFVEREGRLTGIDDATISEYINAAGSAKLTIAGGIRSTEEIARLDRLGCDAQVGMALYTDQFSLAEGFAAPLGSDREDGLWPTVVTDSNGNTLGLCYSNLESVKATLNSGKATYWSRSRGLWQKGQTSGNSQLVRAIKLDCDRDTLCFVVDQQGDGFCHQGTDTCFGDVTGLPALEKVLEQRRLEPADGSYTQKLFSNPALLNSKILEEAEELVGARTEQEIIHEAADLLFFMMAKLRMANVTFAQIEQELNQRALKVTRRDAIASNNLEPSSQEIPS